MSDFPLVIKNLQHAYQDLVVFTDLNLTVKPGEFVAVLGPSGCGKTTLLRAIAGLAHPQNGSIYLAGKCVFEGGRQKIPAEQRHVGLVFQDYALFPFQTVRENIAFGLRQRSADKEKDVQARVDELLRLIDMEAYADRHPAKLSGGQQQRVAIARALATRPQLLLLDEPFANVDTTLRQNLSEQLQMLVRSQGVSVLLVTHDCSEALALSDRVAILDPCGDTTKIAQFDTPEHIYHHPSNRCVAEFLGPAGFIPGEARNGVASTAFGEIALSNKVEGKVDLVLRPEMVSFTENPSGQCEVLARSFQGHVYRLLCKTPVGHIFAETSYMKTPELGTKGEITIKQPCWALKNE